jgi:hypothetical protein
MNISKRPPSVWLAQAVLAFFALLFTSILLLNLVSLLLNLGGEFSVIAILIAFSLTMGIVFLFVYAFWGLAKRRKYGKWLGVLCLTLIWALLLFSQLWPSSGPYKRFEYDNATQAAAGKATQVVLHGLLLLLIFRLAFAKKVNEFFADHVTSNRSNS